MKDLKIVAEQLLNGLNMMVKPSEKDRPPPPIIKSEDSAHLIPYPPSQ
jgi:hypothetical protein